MNQYRVVIVMRREWHFAKSATRRELVLDPGELDDAAGIFGTELSECLRPLWKSAATEVLASALASFEGECLPSSGLYDAFEKLMGAASDYCQAVDGNRNEMKRKVVECP
jgi:hypothetical protein